MRRYYFASSIANLQNTADHAILGELTGSGEFALLPTQRDAWLHQLAIVRNQLRGLDGHVILEYAIPRMGSRVDAIVITGPCVFIIEFKAGATTFDTAAIDQVHDYALDLHYFHEPSHNLVLVPILIATSAKPGSGRLTRRPDRLEPLLVPPSELREVIAGAISLSDGPVINADDWLNGRYSPTPTIVEAAAALFRGHSVEDISRSDAAGESLKTTSDTVARIIEGSRDRSQKSICFVTGVPGAGKTLVGLNIANSHTDQNSDLYSVFLSGNGPLVNVLREALARDAVRQAADNGEKLKKGEARSRVKQFIQNVHHFRDDCLRDPRPPIEHVALFDEAQRAWNLTQTAAFMSRKRNLQNFSQSEPEFLISCLDRHGDWATIVCLVGGGQEINTGEGGIQEWFEALRSFDTWHVYISPQLEEPEFDPGATLTDLETEGRVTIDESLHLFASMRSFRAENVSHLVRSLLEFEEDEASKALQACRESFPIVLTRDLKKAKQWIRSQARGSERYGVLVSSAAERLRPHAIHVRAPVDPIHWFLDGKDDVRSSYYLEDVATEFHIQGLELDWTCVVWDADFRFSDSGWQNYDFVGTRWNRIRSEDRMRYQKNAYRVLLTRARQGMVVVVPEGDSSDATRAPAFYDPTFEYLASIGIPILA
ncbi:MAG: DUF2075 domain-containing protein [Armatimonadetes bacterium]|nr:MAG: DUF2075 domain-containing protein [Armatimonadota bacterium]